MAIHANLRDCRPGKPNSKDLSLSMSKLPRLVLSLVLVALLHLIPTALPAAAAAADTTLNADAPAARPHRARMPLPS